MVHMRIDQVTFTRFLAAISIVVFHFGKNIFPFNHESISFLFRHANIGVSYFFILSGFVMSIAYGNKSRINPFEYLKNRFARIYPVYLLAILLVLTYNITTNSPIDNNGLILNILTMQAWVPGKALSFNYPGWSLSVEIFFYILFPFLSNYIYKEKHFKLLVVLVILIWFISQCTLHLIASSNIYHSFPAEKLDLTYYFPLMHLNEFLIGNLAGLIFMKKFKENNRSYDWLIFFIITIIIIALKYPAGLDYHNGMLAIFFVPLILLISSSNGKLVSILNKKPFIFLGEISYSIYILQLPIFLWSDKLFYYLHINDQIIKFYGSFFFLIIASIISYIIIETPLRKQIKNIRLTSSYNP